MQKKNHHELERELLELGEELDRTRKLLHEAEREIRRLLEILADLLQRCPRLTKIKIQFGDDNMVGPVVLTVGQKTKATVVGFDQFGNPFTGTIPPVTYSVDNPALDSSTPDGANGTDIVSLAEGVANLTASLTTAEGVGLTDTETMTNSAVAPPVPVLSSIKIDFSTPA